MEFLPWVVGRLAQLKLAVVVSGLAQAVLPTRLAWQEEVMQSVRLAEEPFGVKPGRLLSRRLDFLALRVVPSAEQVLEALAT